MKKDNAVPSGVYHQQTRFPFRGSPRIIKAENGLEYAWCLWVNPYLLFLILILLILSFSPPFQWVAYPVPASI